MTFVETHLKIWFDRGFALVFPAIVDVCICPAGMVLILFELPCVAVAGFFIFDHAACARDGGTVAIPKLRIGVVSGFHRFFGSEFCLKPVVIAGGKRNEAIVSGVVCIVVPAFIGENGVNTRPIQQCEQFGGVFVAIMNLDGVEIIAEVLHCSDDGVFVLNVI